MNVAFRCDAGAAIGAGHVMRCIALADELTKHGALTTFVCDTSELPWVDRELARRRMPRVPPVTSPEEHVKLFRELGIDAVVFDSYELPRAVYEGARRNWATLALVDRHIGSVRADIILDQNLDAEEWHSDVPADTTLLAGIQYALIRDEIRQWRPKRVSGTNSSRPKVLVAFGGTDPFFGAEAALRRLRLSGVPFSATAITASPTHADRIGELQLMSGQEVELVEPGDRLGELASTSDLVVSASGSSTWEFLTVGACVAACWVANNQIAGYRALLANRVAIGLGSLLELKSNPTVVDALRRLLTNQDERLELARRGWALADGGGARRVAQRLTALLEHS